MRRTNPTDAEPPLPGRQRPVAHQLRAAVPRGTGLPVRRGGDPVRRACDGSRGPDQRRQGSERVPGGVQRRAARGQVVSTVSDLASRTRARQAGLHGLAGGAPVRGDAAGLERPGPSAGAGSSPWVRLTEARAALESGLAALQVYFRRYDLRIDIAAYANELVESLDRFGVLH